MVGELVNRRRLRGLLIVRFSEIYRSGSDYRIYFLSRTGIFLLMSVTYSEAWVTVSYHLFERPFRVLVFKLGVMNEVLKPWPQ
jgi:hypothetical protein